MKDIQKVANLSQADFYLLFFVWLYSCDFRIIITNIERTTYLFDTGPKMDCLHYNEFDSCSL